MRHRFEDHTEWASWVTPRHLHEHPVHRWYVFPHSFSDQLVASLAYEWKLKHRDRIVDPFVGSGTTVRAAQELGISSTGFDLSPLAIFATRVKTADYDMPSLKTAYGKVKRCLRVYEPGHEAAQYSELVVRAMAGKRLATFHSIKNCITDRLQDIPTREFFYLALISIIPDFSSARATGGWLSWVRPRRATSSIPSAFKQRVELMLEDISPHRDARSAKWEAKVSDARKLPMRKESCSAVITSPPYPNRHDYTRVFGVELMFGFMNWEKTRELRYQSFHSHPESKPSRPSISGYREPQYITHACKAIHTSSIDDRIPLMLHGYFCDLYLSLREISRVLRPGGHAAIVVGNAQYGGAPIEVDRATADIALQCGMSCDSIRIARLRGNSAQQMRVFGRIASRESVVMLRKA